MPSSDASPETAAAADLLRRLEQDDAFTVLSVVPIAPEHRQDELIQAVGVLRHMMCRPVRLVLAGPVASPEYRATLLSLCTSLGMEGWVEFAGEPGKEALDALYRGSGVFLSLSAQQDVVEPLLQAMASDLPVVAHASGAVAEAIGLGGLLLSDKRPEVVAATLKVLVETPELRRRLVLAGRARLARREEGCLPSDAARWRVEGPFDSSYSLALVNRHLALALAAGTDAELFATEGPGDYQPDSAFLSAHPAVNALWQKGRARRPADVVLRNLYPPRVTGMHGATRVLACYGWEESGFPTEHVEQFNRHLNLICTVSTYVARVLRDNGVVVPIAVVGDGVDHIGRSDPVAPRHFLGRGKYRFLHASSCFPRKGLDALLAAWGEAFTAADDVTLVVKTFPNPHNDAAEQIAELDRRVPGHAEVVLIDEDVDEAQMAGFYLACDALVMPSRGEGFGLPAGEAMWFERPVITTAHGGQTDFCTEETAWLVDYRLTSAETHFGLAGSVWAEPDVADLARALRSLYAASPEQRQPRVSAARDMIRGRFTWAEVAWRTRLAVRAIDDLPAVAPHPLVAWYRPSLPPSTVPAAEASARLDAAFPPASLYRVGHECDDPYAAIAGSDATVAVLHCVLGNEELVALAAGLDRLRAAGVGALVVLHWPAAEDSAIRAALTSVRASLAAARRLIVPGVKELNQLKECGLLDNAVLLAPGRNVKEWHENSRRLWAMVSAPPIFGWECLSGGQGPLSTRSLLTLAQDDTNPVGG